MPSDDTNGQMTRTSIRLPDELMETLREYQQQYHLDSQSEAARVLLSQAIEHWQSSAPSPQLILPPRQD